MIETNETRLQRNASFIWPKSFVNHHVNTQQEVVNYCDVYVFQKRRQIYRPLFYTLHSNRVSAKKVTVERSAKVKQSGNLKQHYANHDPKLGRIVS